MHPKATIVTAATAPPPFAKAATATEYTCWAWVGRGWGNTSTHDVTSGCGVDDDVIRPQLGHALHFLRSEHHAKDGHLLMECVGPPPIVSSLGEELGVTRMPNELYVRIGVALECELVLHPVRPHIVKVRALLFRDDIDSFPHACDENVGVVVIGVKLGPGPTHCVENELRHIGFESKIGCAWHGYEEVVGVRASDKVVLSSPLTTSFVKTCQQEKKRGSHQLHF